MREQFVIGRWYKCIKDFAPYKKDNYYKCVESDERYKEFASFKYYEPHEGYTKNGFLGDLLTSVFDVNSCVQGTQPMVTLEFNVGGVANLREKVKNFKLV